MPALLDTILKVVFIVFFFGFCIFIHEFGHLLVAIWCGLHAEKFSIGMGPRLCGFRWHGIDFIVSWLPFGGYVSLPQLDPTDHPKAGDGRELPPARPAARAATAFAGPLFNVLFGLLLATVMCIAGLWLAAPASSVVVLEVPEKIYDGDGTAQEEPNPEWVAGLRDGDRIIAINGKRFTGGADEFLKEYVYSNSAEITLEYIRDGAVSQCRYPVRPNPTRENLGFPFFYAANPVQVREVLPGPLQEAGMANGDLLLSCNQRNIANVSQMQELIRADAGSPLNFTVERGGREVQLPPVRLPEGCDLEQGLLPALGLSFGACVEAVLEGTPAEQAGVLAGDYLLKVEVLEGDGGAVSRSVPVHAMRDFMQTVLQSAGAPLRITLKRTGRQLVITTSARLNRDYDPPIWQVGIILSDRLDKVLSHPSPWRQFSTVMGTTARTLGLLFSPLTRRVKSVFSTAPSGPAPTAAIGLRHMSGPGGILMMLWYKLQSEGYRGGFAFIILITFSLAFMNLLPLPVLDGGHILFAGIEAVIHRRLPSRALTWIYNIFAGLLIALMLYITVFDGRRAWKLFRNSHPEKNAPAVAAPAEDAPAEPAAEPTEP